MEDTKETIDDVRRALEKQKRKVKQFVVYGIFLGFILSSFVSTCLINDIGPANEIGCIYKGTHNPTLKEMLLFVLRDNTDKNEWNDEYKCHHFTMDVIAHAKQDGIQAGYVKIYAVPTNHAIVAFKTTDAGMYYLEPQNDRLFSQIEMDDMEKKGIYSFESAYSDNQDFFNFTDYSINWLSCILSWKRSL